MTKHRLKTSPFWAIAVVAALGMGLSACGSSDDDTAEAPTVTEPTGPTQAELDAAEAARMKAEMERDEAQAELDAAKAKENLATARALIAALAARPTFQAPDGDPSDDPMPSITVTASYGMDGAGAKIAASRDATSEQTVADTKLDPGFSASGEMADPISGWAGLMFGREDKGKTGSGSMVVYTNIEASVTKPFTEVHGTAADADNTATANALEIGSTYLIANVGKVVSSGFATQGAKAHGADSRSFSGTFDGAPGTYSCPADNCTSARSDAGALSIGAGWQFKADTGATVTIADADHLHFGWWLRKGADGDPAWVHAFAGGSTTAITNTDIGAAIGAATYKGGAAGKYAIRSLGGTTGGGHWTAMSELKAKFGDATGNGSISGKIYGFMAGGEEMPWEVTLGNDDDISEAGAGAATTWKIEGEAAKGGTGTWSGNFYNATARTETQPSGVAGTFDANFGSAGGDHTGRMTGAFAATRQ